MITRILKPLDDLISAKTYVDAYGGLAQQAVSVEEIEGSGVFNTAIFPVSMHTTGEECLSGNYSDMVPDASRKSIFYFEGLTDLNFSEIPGQKQPARTSNAGRVATVDYRLVGWLNLPQLGESEMISDLIVGDLLGSIHGKTIENPPYLPFVSKIKFKVIKQSNRDIKIFSRYSYGANMALLLYPYDFFGLVVRAQITLKGGDCYNYEEGQALGC